MRLRLSTATFAVVIAALAASLFLFASSGRSQIPASKEASDSAANPSESAPTFYRDVLPILQQHCQRCHRRDEIAPFPLVTYGQARDKAAKIARVTSARQMPPWFADPRFSHFSDDPSLTPQQIETFSAWARLGAPAGDPHDAPPPRKWAKGWVIRHPDTIVRMPAPVAIPARGDVEYTYEIVPTGFKTDKWIQMSEIRPSSRANVHHAVVYVRPPNRNGCDTRRLACHSRHPASRTRRPAATRAGRTLPFCSFMLREVRLTNGRTGSRNSFRRAQTSSSRCTT